MFWGSKEKKMKPGEAEKVIEEVTTPTPIPFLEREKPITDLNSLCSRIGELNNCIDRCKREVNWAESKLEDDGLINVSGGVWELLTEEEIKSINDIIRHRLEVYAAHQKDLMHTCQDELDWLQMKIGMGSPVLKNKFKSGDFNFDPYKDHC